MMVYIYVVQTRLSQSAVEMTVAMLALNLVHSQSDLLLVHEETPLGRGTLWADG